MVVRLILLVCCSSPLDKLLILQNSFDSSAVGWQPSLVQTNEHKALLDAQTLPLNNTNLISALLSDAQNPNYVSSLIIEPYLVPQSPPPQVALRPCKHASFCEGCTVIHQ